jgi:hypothetical protein
MGDVRYMETETALDEFVMKMRNVLDENEERKGNSWAYCDLQFLLDKLDEEIKEFKDEPKPLAKAEELADVANICMMLYHRYVDIWAEKASKILSS